MNDAPDPFDVSPLAVTRGLLLAATVWAALRVLLWLVG